MDKKNRIVIIGTGISGTAVLLELSHKLKISSSTIGKDKDFEICTISAQASNGGGLAFDPMNNDPSHILNQPAISMSALSVDRNGKVATVDHEYHKWESYDFYLWIIKNKELLIKTYPDAVRASTDVEQLNEWEPLPTEYYSRSIYGLYMKEVFDNAVERLREKGALVNIFNETRAVALETKFIDGRHAAVVRLKKRGSGSENTIIADKLLIAIGRGDRTSSSERKRPYYSSFFPSREVIASLRSEMRSRKLKVAVLGMGLTGIDAILSLVAGRFARGDDGVLRYWPDKRDAEIYAFSRSGHFPIVKGESILKPELKVFTEDALQKIKSRNKGYLTLRELYFLIESELSQHLDEGWDLVEHASPSIGAEDKLLRDIRNALSGNVVYGVFMKILSFELYSKLCPEDKEYFINNLRATFLQNIAAMPMRNAEKILALIESGIINVVAIGYGKSTVDILGECVQITYQRKPGKSVSIVVDKAINARGDNLDYRGSDDPFIRSLLDSGELLACQEKTYQKGSSLSRTRDSDAGNGSLDHQLANTGGVCVDKRDFSVITGEGKKSTTIYAIGLLAMNWGVERDFASSSTKAAKNIVESWANELNSSV